MLVLREGAGCWRRPALLLREKMLTWLQTLRGSPPPHTLKPGPSSSAGERRGEPCPLSPVPQGCPAPATVTHLCPVTVMLEVGDQRSVTLFSSAVAICWSLERQSSGQRGPPPGR